MIKGIHHTGLSVTNLDRAIAYFGTMSAFKTAARFEIPDAPSTRTALGVKNAAAQVALLRGPTGYLEVFEFAETVGHARASPAVFEAGIRHICLQAIDVNPLFDAMTDHGGSFHARPSGLGTGALYCYIRDPEHNVIELEGVPWGPSEPSAPWYAHTAIVTPDIARLSAFYEKLIGIDVHERGTFGPHAKYDKVAGVEGVEFHGAWIRVGNATVEFWEYEKPRTQPAAPGNISALGWNQLCFEVDDIDAEYHRLKIDGYTLHAAPISNDIAKFFCGKDPDGNVFKLMQLDNAFNHLSVDRLEGLSHLRRLDEAIAIHYRREA